MRALPRWSYGVLVAAACGSPEVPPDDEEHEGPRQLVDPGAWTEVVGERDPFAAGPPTRRACDPEIGFGPEPFGGVDAFEVYTGACNWVTVEQPLLEDVRPGDLVKPRLWHFDLTSPTPAEGYAAVAFEGETVWDYRTPIPAPGRLVAHGFVAEDGIPEGTMVQFHVDNHGSNAWSLIEITTEPADDEGTG